MKAVIKMDVPEWQIGQPVMVYFKDTMVRHTVCEADNEWVKPRISSVEVRCGNCNKIIEMDGWRVCPWCGKKVEWV